MKKVLKVFLGKLGRRGTPEHLDLLELMDLPVEPVVGAQQDPEGVLGLAGRSFTLYVAQ